MVEARNRRTSTHASREGPAEGGGEQAQIWGGDRVGRNDRQRVPPIDTAVRIHPGDFEFGERDELGVW